MPNVTNHPKAIAGFQNAAFLSYGLSRPKPIPSPLFRIPGHFSPCDRWITRRVVFVRSRTIKLALASYG